jgi:gamma-glutamyltranspeptidase/glutathione hydrolase
VIGRRARLRPGALARAGVLALAGWWLAGCAGAPGPALGAVAAATPRAAAAAEPALAAAAASAAAATASAAQPEAGSGWTPKPGWTFNRSAVAAAHPLAADAGLAMLRAGGSAIDAAIAAQAVLTLVEPQSSGIGGGALLLYWDGRAVQAWDGRETAPAAADPRAFLGADGRPLAQGDAVFGGRAVATPGALAMLEAVHQRHGRLPWAQLFAPAIALCDSGFPLGARLHALLLRDPLLRRDAQARAYFYRADDSPHPVGHRLKNPALAAVLRAVAAGGSAAFHRGPIAADLVARVRGHAVPGSLSLDDMAAYTPLQRLPLCADWQDLRVCGFPPPSSGQIATLQILGLLQAVPASGPGAVAAGSGEPPGADGAPGADWLHLYFEASRLAYADRAQFVADPAFVPAPAGDWASLFDRAYLQERAALIGTRRMPTVSAGQPGGKRSAFAPMPDQPEHGTSHLSIVDAAGHAVALTTSIEAAFGARLMADGGSGLPGGYLLNNQMTDFSFQPSDAQGRPVANRIEPGKRPRSSMAPTLVFSRPNGQGGPTPETDRAGQTGQTARQGCLLMVLGSPGGPVIPHFIAHSLLGSLAWGRDLQRAFELPHFAHLGGPALLEAGRFAPATVQALRARGHGVVETELTSGLHGLQRSAAGWLGAADPRREGTVRGEGETQAAAPAMGCSDRR